jgi:hypothetical protein
VTKWFRCVLSAECLAASSPVAKLEARWEGLSIGDQGRPRVAWEKTRAGAVKEGLEKHETQRRGLQLR